MMLQCICMIKLSTGDIYINMYILLFHLSSHYRPGYKRLRRNFVIAHPQSEKIVHDPLHTYNIVLWFNVVLMKYILCVPYHWAKYRTIHKWCSEHLKCIHLVIFIGVYIDCVMFILCAMMRCWFIYYRMYTILIICCHHSINRNYAIPLRPIKRCSEKFSTCNFCTILY